MSVRVRIITDTSETHIDMSSGTITTTHSESQDRTAEGMLGELVDMAKVAVAAATAPQPVQPPPYKRRKR